jgi:hypothetical protein
MPFRAMNRLTRQIFGKPPATPSIINRDRLASSFNFAFVFKHLA